MRCPGSQHAVNEQTGTLSEILMTDMSSRVHRYEGLLPVARSIVLFLILAGICLNLACSEDKSVTSSANVEELTDWTAESHGDAAAPDYDGVFSDGVVRRIDIEIDSANWKRTLHVAMGSR